MSTDVRALQELPSLHSSDEDQPAIFPRQSPHTIVCTICSIPSLATESESTEA